MSQAFWLLFFLALPLCGATTSEPLQPEKIEQRANDLKNFLEKEKSRFESREFQKKSLLSSLDEANKQQNIVRQKLFALHEHQQELSMSLENLALEVQNQKHVQEAQKERLFLLLKVVYQIQKEGVLRYLLSGRDLTEVTGKIRILIHTLKAHARLKAQFEKRVAELSDSEFKLKTTQLKLAQLASDLNEQQKILEKLLLNKNRLVQEINRKQSHYRKVSKEYRAVSHQLSQLFKSLAKKAKKKTQHTGPEPSGNLPLPTPGEIVQGFGKSIHEKFKTVTYHKGILIESEFNSPVIAVLPGTVEYAGWLKGLGNVMILDHGEGLFTLSAQLFKFNKVVGEVVGQGETIGFVGDTGNSEKPSLYFEVRANGQAVDPMKYITTEKVS